MNYNDYINFPLLKEYPQNADFKKAKKEAEDDYAKKEANYNKKMAANNNSNQTKPSMPSLWACLDTDFKNNHLYKHYDSQQKHLCAYCRRPQEFKDKYVKMDIEHILPKSKYPQFTLEPKNYCLSCRWCNVKEHKGEEDVGVNITTGETNYDNLNSDNFSIINPRFDTYSDYIKIDKGGIPMPVDGKDGKGAKTIEMFKLYDTQITIKHKDRIIEFDKDIKSAIRSTKRLSRVNDPEELSEEIEECIVCIERVRNKYNISSEEYLNYEELVFGNKDAEIKAFLNALRNADVNSDEFKIDLAEFKQKFLS